METLLILGTRTVIREDLFGMMRLMETQATQLQMILFMNGIQKMVVALERENSANRLVVWIQGRLTTSGHTLTTPLAILTEKN